MGILDSTRSLRKPINSRQRRVGSFQLTVGLVLAVGAILCSFPFIWMILSAFKTPGEMDLVPPTLWPRVWTLENLVWVWDSMNFPRLFGNSMVVTITATASALYTSALLGYVLAKFEFTGRNVVFSFIISQMFIPGQLGMIVRWFIFHEANLLDTYLALIIPGLYSVFGIFMMRQYMHTIPNELLDAARIDGASELGIFHRVVLPNVGPALSALGIFTFLGIYDSFTWPLIALNSPKMYTVPVGLAFFQGEYFSNLARAMAGTTVAVIPTLVVFLLFQRRIVEGVTLSGMGGQ